MTPGSGVGDGSFVAVSDNWRLRVGADYRKACAWLHRRPRAYPSLEWRFLAVGRTGDDSMEIERCNRPSTARLVKLSTEVLLMSLDREIHNAGGRPEALGERNSALAFSIVQTSCRLCLGSGSGDSVGLLA